MRICTLRGLSLGLSGILVGCTETSSPLLPAVSPSIAAGAQHTCALDLTGRAFCWGNGGLGRLGNGADTSSRQPVAVATSLRFTAITAGRSHACGLTSGRKAYCWGGNNFGQLGDGTLATRTTPVPVQGNVSFIAISAGADHTCGLSAANRVYCWGDNETGQLGQPSASDTICGVPCARSPVQVDAALAFTSLSAGGYHTCALSTDRRAYCWGWDYSGQVGGGFYTIYPVDRPYPVLTTLSFLSIASGAAHTCAIAQGGLAYCWGGGTTGQLGNDSSGSGNYADRPVPVVGGLSYTSLSAGSLHTCGLLTNGATVCWGAGPLGTAATSYNDTPIAPDGDLRFTDLASGEHHQCGATLLGAVYCWGDNTFGQIGTGSTDTWTTVAAAVALPGPIP